MGTTHPGASRACCFVGVLLASLATMRVPRLLLECALVPGAELRLDPEVSRYLLSVLRLQPGAAVLVFNGRDGEFAAQVHSATKNAATLRLAGQTRAAQQSPDVTLAFAPLKRQATDLIIEKATELGVRAIAPVFTQRTVAETVRLERWAAIAREAAEQCERLEAPTIAAPKPLAAFLSEWDATRPLLFADERGDAAPLAEALQASAQTIALLIGPEGGFDPAEAQLLRSLSFVRPISLGPRILRAETAAIAGLALIQALWGDRSR